MKNKMKYAICITGKAKDMTPLIDDVIKKGGKPIGGISVVQSIELNIDYEFYQAVLIPDEKKKIKKDDKNE